MQKTEQKILVICPNRDRCTIPTCMHHEPHEPVDGNCHMVMSACLDFLSKCEEVKDATD